MQAIIAWVVLLIAFAAIEGLTITLVSIWFCIGSLAALVAATFGTPLGGQIAIFAVVSLVCIGLIRPFTKKFLVKHEEKTNADRIIDADGIVIEPINNLQASGQIKVKGEYWTARSAQDEEIQAGEQVRVLRIEGVKAIVEKK